MHELFELDIIYLSHMIHWIVVHAFHVIVKFCIKDCKVRIEEGGNDIINILSMCLELKKVLIEISMDSKNVFIYSDCIACELEEVGAELMVYCIGTKGGKMHDCHLKERGSNFLDSLFVDSAVIAVEENLGLGLLGA